MDRFRSTFCRDRSLRARRAHISNIDMTQGNWRMKYFTYLYEKKQQYNEVVKRRRSRLNVDPLQTLFKECRCWKSMALVKCAQRMEANSSASCSVLKGLRLAELRPVQIISRYSDCGETVHMSEMDAESGALCHPFCVLHTYAKQGSNSEFLPLSRRQIWPALYPATREPWILMPFPLPLLSPYCVAHGPDLYQG
jgi:hypothetical protein